MVVNQQENHKRWQESHKESIRGYSKRYNQNLKKEVLTHYSRNGIVGCSRCGIDDVDVLCIDHINGKGNKHRETLSRSYRHGIGFYLWLRNNSFPNGFQVLCFNCNIKKHLKQYK